MTVLVSTYAQIVPVVILMHIWEQLPVSQSNMSCVRSIHFVPVFLFVCALAPATEGMEGFLLTLRDRVPYINRQLKIILCLLDKIWGRG